MSWEGWTKRTLHLFFGLVNGLSAAAAAMAAAMLALMALLIVTEVMLRKLFNSSTFMADEMAGYLLAGIAFMGFAYTLRTERHIRIMVLANRLPRRVQDILEMVVFVIGLALALMLAREAWLVVSVSYQLGSRADTVVRTPLYLPQSVMLVGLALFALQLLAITLRKFGWLRSLPGSRGDAE